MSEIKPLTRSEREALLKDKAGWIITVLAALLAINTLLAGSNSSKILNNTIEANNTWSFYQAKSIKQTLAEMALEDAKRVNDHKRITALTAKIDRYDNEPVEGKKDLMAKAKRLEQERSVAKAKSPWYTYAGSLLQIAIVLLTASILAVNRQLFRASVITGSIATILMTQAIWSWIPLIL
jgi:ABC-type transport system involved in cytochrome c biogenesis permease component